MKQKRVLIYIGVFLLATVLAMCAFPARSASLDCKGAAEKIAAVRSTGLHWQGDLNADDGDGCYYVFKVDELGVIVSATATFGDQVVYQTGQ